MCVVATRGTGKATSRVLLQKRGNAHLGKEYGRRPAEVVETRSMMKTRPSRVIRARNLKRHAVM